MKNTWKKFFFSFLKRFSHYFIPFLGSCRNLEKNIPYSSHKMTLKNMYVCNKLELENLKTVLMAFGCVFLNCDIFLNNGQIKKKKGISLTYGPRAIRQHRFWYKIMIFFFVCSSYHFGTYFTEVSCLGVGETPIEASTTPINVY